MYKHEKQAVERLQSNHIHMLSTLSTAIIAFFLIISLSGTLLFPMMAFADEPQPVAQVGNTTYMSVQDAIGHTSMKNNTVTLLSDATESVTVTPPKVVRGVTLELNGHALNASNTTAITVPANMQLTITGSGTVAGGDNPAIDCRGALQIQEKLHIEHHAHAVRGNKRHLCRGQYFLRNIHRTNTDRHVGRCRTPRLCEQSRR
nr:hypothetical protein [Bifidobacterium catenulatum]